MRIGPLACSIVLLCACGPAPGPATAVDPTLRDEPGFWVEQPRPGEVGVDWPPPRSVLEVELDASLAHQARVELRLDDEVLWEGPYTEPVGVALPAGEHKVGVAVVASGGAGRADASFDAARGCRVRMTASARDGGVHLEQHVDCGSAP